VRISSFIAIFLYLVFNAEFPWDWTFSLPF